MAGRKHKQDPSRTSISCLSVMKIISLEKEKPNQEASWACNANLRLLLRSMRPIAHYMQQRRLRPAHLGTGNLCWAPFSFWNTLKLIQEMPWSVEVSRCSAHAPEYCKAKGQLPHGGVSQRPQVGSWKHKGCLSQARTTRLCGAA